MECIQKMEQREKETPETLLDGDFVSIYNGMGNLDKAFEYLEKGIARKSGPAKLYLEHPMFKNIKADPRYKKIEPLLGE